MQIEKHTDRGCVSHMLCFKGRKIRLTSREYKELKIVFVREFSHRLREGVVKELLKKGGNNGG